MTTLIEKARAATYAHNHEEIDRKAAEETAFKLKREQELADADVWAKKEMPLVAEGIYNAAKNGMSNTKYAISYWEDRTSLETVDRARALAVLIMAEGFNVREHIDVEEPCGSDSYFPNRVVMTSLVISW
jgi:hypothetical protein